MFVADSRRGRIEGLPAGFHKTLNSTRYFLFIFLAKIEGVTFGPNVRENGQIIHTLWIANDNDFLQTVLDANNNPIPNPNQFFVFGFTDEDLGGSKFVPLPIRSFPF